MCTQMILRLYDRCYVSCLEKEDLLCMAWEGSGNER